MAGTGQYAFPVIAPPEGMEGAAAAHAAGDEATEQARVATEKATAQLAPLTVEQKQSELRDAQLKSDTATLGRIVPMMTQNPGLANSPVLKKTVSAMFQRMGIPTPMDAAGALDVPTLQAFTAQPMSAVGVQHTMDSVDKVVKEFEDPKTSMTPEQFGKAIQAKYNLLMHTGNIPEAESLIAYITPDGKPSPEYSERVVSQYVDAQMRHLDNLGIVVQQRQQFQQDMFTERKREFDASFGEKKYEFGQRMEREDRRIRIQADATKQRLADAQTRIGFAQQNLQLAKDRFQQTRSVEDLHAYQAIVNSTRGMLNSWRTELSSTVGNIRQMTASQLKSKEGQDLVAQASTLKSLIDQNQQAFDAESVAAQQGVGQAAAAITGNPTIVKTPTPTGGKAVRTGVLEGRKVEQRTDGHVYYAGTNDRVPGQP